MPIDLQKLEQQFNALFEDENIITEFEQWLKVRSVSQNSSKPIVSRIVLPPAPVRVKITKCSFEQGWYKNLVGEEFDVDNAGGNYDYVLWEDYAGKRTMWRHIAKSDCEVVSRHCR